jgi:Tfp pilus assembly pilus retraction ATPase PilT
VSASPEREPEIHKLFRLVPKLEASGFELEVGFPPGFWLRGYLRRIDMRNLSAEDLERLVFAILWADQQERLEQGEEVGFIYGFEAGLRFRVLVTKRHDGLRFSARRIVLAERFRE